MNLWSWCNKKISCASIKNRGSVLGLFYNLPIKFYCLCVLTCKAEYATRKPVLKTRVSYNGAIAVAATWIIFYSYTTGCFQTNLVYLFMKICSIIKTLFQLVCFVLAPLSFLSVVQSWHCMSVCVLDSTLLELTAEKMAIYSSGPLNLVKISVNLLRLPFLGVFVSLSS